MHMIVHIKKPDGREILFKNVYYLKKFIISHKNISECPLVDLCVYRKNGGLMRTINQSKKHENRPLIKTCSTSSYSDHMIANLSITENVNNFDIYKENSCERSTSNTNSIALNSYPCITSEWINLTVLDFLQKWYESLNKPFYRIHKITINENNSLFALYRGYCMFINETHKSNNQTLHIDNKLITFKCLDIACSNKKLCVPSEKYISDTTLNLLLRDHGQAIVTNIIKKVDDGVESVTRTSNICFEAACPPLLKKTYCQKLIESPTKYKHVVSTLNHEIKHNHTGHAISVSKVDLKMINNFCFQVHNNNNNIINNISDNIHLQDISRINTRNKLKSYNIISDSLVVETWMTHKQKQLIVEYFSFPVTKTLIELFFEFYTQILCYSSGIYYQYGDDVYTPVKHTQDLIATFENTIETLFDNIKQTLRKKNHAQELIDTLCPIYNSLNSSHTKNKLLSYIICKYEIPSMYEKMDSDYMIIPFKSNFYDHRTRSFLPKKLSYDVGFELNDDLVKNFMFSIFPDLSLYNMVMQILANSLIPIEPPRFLFTLYGSLMPLCNTRVAFCLEPTKQSLSSSMVKKLCGGGDTIVCRPLYSNIPIYFKNIATMFMSSNDIPIFDDVDQALSSRLVIIPFTRIFVETPKHKNERKIDMSLSNKIYINDEFKIGLMSSLLKMIMTVDTGKIGDKGKYREYLAKFHNFIKLTKENYPLTTFGCHRNQNKDVIKGYNFIILLQNKRHADK
ncbi:hypothetical protein HZS_32, partial [Henneguya salminicola]